MRTHALIGMLLVPAALALPSYADSQPLTALSANLSFGLLAECASGRSAARATGGTTTPFVLDKSSVARASLLRFLTSAGCSVPTEARFKSQAVGSGGEIPDLSGTAGRDVGLDRKPGTSNLLV